jgi:hypothetical protein
METEQIMSESRWRRSVKVFVLAGALILCGMSLRAVTPAQVEVRTDKDTATQHFKSGGQISAAELKDIVQTLKQIDSRLARIENALLRAVEEGK